MKIFLLPVFIVSVLAASITRVDPRLNGFLSPGLSERSPISPRSPPPTTFDINTNYYTNTPITGVVREYTFDVTSETVSPDGVPRQMMLVNGQWPGPTIHAKWGDVVVVHVNNHVETNGTSIHFHGVRMLNNNQNDGAVSVTQCPVAPGSSYTYVWRAEQYGSSFWHSHFSLQAWEGVFGGIVIDGPSAAPYDEDLGVLFLNDWKHETFHQMYEEQVVLPSNAQMDNGLINMTNVFTKPDGSVVGQRFKMKKFKPGKKYRIRLVNAAIHTNFKFSIDNHDLKVIASDFVPIRPFNTKFVALTMGQRYDIIVEANQAPGNYWLRAVPQTFCSNILKGDNVKGIVSYEGAPNADPTTTKWDYGDDVQCEDMPNIEPWLALDAPVNNSTARLNDPVGIGPVGSPGIFLWNIGGRTFNVSWRDPTLRYPSTPGNPNPTLPDAGAIEINTPNRWTVVIITTNLPVPHPIHLHGHDIFVLAAGFGPYSNSTVWKTQNPPRRDIAFLPTDATGGYLVIAFPADNPGAWLLHCHMGFHASSGFAQQIVERKAEFWKFLNPKVLKDTCDDWDEWAEENPYGIQYRGTNGPYESGI